MYETLLALFPEFLADSVLVHFSYNSVVARVLRTHQDLTFIYLFFHLLKSCSLGPSIALPALYLSDSFSIFRFQKKWNFLEKTSLIWQILLMRSNMPGLPFLPRPVERLPSLPAARQGHVTSCGQ